MLFASIITLLILESIISGIVGFGLILAYYVLYAIGAYKLFSKANVPGIYAFIPLVNEYQTYKLAWNSTYFWVYLGCDVVSQVFFNKENSSSFIEWAFSIISLVLQFMLADKLAKAFGKGMGFALGLFLFPPIFIMILGLGDSEYQGPQQ